MLKRFLKTIAIAYTISLTLLGGTGSAWGMWHTELHNMEKSRAHYWAHRHQGHHDTCENKAVISHFTQAPQAGRVWRNRLPYVINILRVCKECETDYEDQKQHEVSRHIEAAALAIRQQEEEQRQIAAQQAAALAIRQQEEEQRQIAAQQAAALVIRQQEEEQRQIAAQQAAALAIRQQEEEQRQIAAQQYSWRSAYGLFGIIPFVRHILSI